MKWRNLNRLFKLIRPLRCGRGDHVLLIDNQTLSHFDRNEVKRRNLILLYNLIRPLRVGRGDQSLACYKHSLVISTAVEKSQPCEV